MDGTHVEVCGNEVRIEICKRYSYNEHQIEGEERVCVPQYLRMKRLIGNTLENPEINNLGHKQ
jgi:hypothetical protein